MYELMTKLSVLLKETTVSFKQQQNHAQPYNAAQLKKTEAQK